MISCKYFMNWNFIESYIHHHVAMNIFKSSVFLFFLFVKFSTNVFYKPYRYYSASGGFYSITSRITSSTFIHFLDSHFFVPYLLLIFLKSHLLLTMKFCSCQCEKTSKTDTKQFSFVAVVIYIFI